MTDQEFTLVLDRVPSDDDVEALFEAGCDDATPETDRGVSLLHFDRESHSLSDALTSAIRDTERAGLSVKGVQTDDLVSIKDIATRVDRSAESVRLLASAQRGPGGFPPPMSSSGWSLYSWAQVRDWYADNNFKVTGSVRKYDRVIAAVDHMLRARDMLVGDADRAELSKLIDA